MDPEAAELFKTAFGEPGEAVPVVDVADLKAMWVCTEKARRNNIAFGRAATAGVCSLTADERAVGYRCTMLGLIEKILRPMWSGGELSEAAFKVAAKMDLKWMAFGKTGTLDVGGFIAQVQTEAA